MSNAILLNWLNLSSAYSRLPNDEKPILQEQLCTEFGELLNWYKEFTDVPLTQLTQVEDQYNTSFGKAEKSEQHALRGTIYCAIEFLRAYMEPGEIVNMSQFGANENESAELSNMIGKLAIFHATKLKSFKWLVDWLEKVDPLFPADIFRNKLACCYSEAKQKYCYTNGRQCIFKSSLSWIRTPAATLSGRGSNADCCLSGSTLSSCSGGGTLECSCVSGVTCDCKAPDKLCHHNEGRVTVSVAGFGGISQAFNPLEKDRLGDSSLKLPACLVLDSLRYGSCIDDQVPSAFKGPLCQTLDLGKGQFITMDSGFNLRRLVMTTKDCQQTGFCPPHVDPCPGLC